MKYTFEIHEHLARRVSIDADNLAEAMNEVYSRLDNEEIVLDSSDFYGGELHMRLGDNFLPYLEHCGEQVENKNEIDLILDIW